MPSNLEVLQAEVLRISPADRARLLERSVASLDVDASVEAAWDAVADQREQELSSGTVDAVPLAVAAIMLLILPPLYLMGWFAGCVLVGYRPCL